MSKKKKNKLTKSEQNVLDYKEFNSKYGKLKEDVFEGKVEGDISKLKSIYNHILFKEKVKKTKNRKRKTRRVLSIEKKAKYNNSKVKVMSIDKVNDLLYNDGEKKTIKDCLQFK